MKEKEAIVNLLKSATESVKRSARRKKIPLAVSRKGQVIIIPPEKDHENSKSVRKLKKA